MREDNWDRTAVHGGTAGIDHHVWFYRLCTAQESLPSAARVCGVGGDGG